MAATALAISAYYHEVGDFIEVQTTLTDSDDEPIDAAQIRALSVTLLRGEATMAQVTGLDKFWVDSTLWFNVRFNKPAATTRLTVRVACTERSTDLDWTKTVNVRLAEYSPVEDDLGDNRPNLAQ